ncbi:MAG: DUF371 domain-containing protein [Candidatus Bathyarchaeota archaeon]|nr:DUF371 domain-containing protein [Candidatus Bathyarchaeota archaeon]
MFQEKCGMRKRDNVQRRETVLARGNENILATHETTFEVTKESYLSKRGTCIIAVSANKALNDLSWQFKNALRSEKAKLTIQIEANGIIETVNALGSRDLVLTHPTDMVVRKSRYVCDRTLAVQADKAACDFSRKLVEKLSDPNQEVSIKLTVVF